MLYGLTIFRFIMPLNMSERLNSTKNRHTTEKAFMNVCNSLGYGYTPKFNFPTCENFGKLLEGKGFVIDKIYDYDRPTPLKDGEQGLANWMKQFFASELARMPKDIQITTIRKVEELTRVHTF